MNIVTYNRCLFGICNYGQTISSILPWKKSGNVFAVQAVQFPNVKPCVVGVEWHANVSTYIFLYSVLQKLSVVKPDLQIHMWCQLALNCCSRWLPNLLGSALSAASCHC